MQDRDRGLELAAVEGAAQLEEVALGAAPGLELERDLRLEQKGRGRALKRAWQSSDADVVSYMDVDLSTNLDAFLPLVRSIAEEGYDVSKVRKVPQRWN